MIAEKEKPAFFDWSEQPVFYAAAFFAAGVVLGHVAEVRQRQWLALIAVLLGAAAIVLWSRRRTAVAFALAAFVSIGGLCAHLQGAARPPATDLSRYTTESMEVVAHITSVSMPRKDAMERNLQMLQVETETLTDGSTLTPLRIGLRLTLHDNGKPLPELQYGDRIRFIARLREPRNYGNPGAMDYRGYLAGKGIIALASVPSTSVEVLPGAEGTPLGFARAKVRDSLLRHMLSLAREPCGSWSCMSGEDVGVLAAMILGEQSLLERATKIDFQQTGAFHILVVSGMNVGIVAFAVFWLCRRLRLNEILATASTILLSLVYAYITEMGAPILRAVLMLSIYLVARLVYRERYSLNSIGVAALILLVAFPSSLFDASFQLTFLSVAALGGIVHPLLQRSAGPYLRATRRIELSSYDTVLEPRLAQFRLDIRLIASRIAQLLPSRPQPATTKALSACLRGGFAFVEVVMVAAVLQVALALPMVWYFHRMALAGVPANAVIVPLTTLLMPLGIIASLSSYISTAAAQFLATITALVLHGILSTVVHLSRISWADIRLPVPRLWVAVICAATFGLALFAFKRTRAVAWISGSALSAGALLLAFPLSPAGTRMAEITSIDVGQGDAILVVSPEGRTLLIDGGGPPGFAQTNTFDVGEDVVSSYLWTRGFSRLDAIMLTHAHSDHMDGLRAVLRNFRPKELWLGAANPEVSALLAIAQRNNTRIRFLQPAEHIRLGGIDFKVVSTGLRDGVQHANNDSVVLGLGFERNSALLLGDAERALEREVAHDLGPVDVLKVAHHGSSTSTTPELLAATRPKFAVISVGAHNAYGHPRAEVVDRLKSAQAQLYRTDRDGATTFLLNGRTVSVETFYGQR